MKGLMLKDFYLTFSNRSTLLLYVLITVFMGFSMDGEFVIAYATLLSGTMALSTISYDEFENGLPFLMSLPTDRKTYVRAKFLYCTLLNCAGVIMGVIIYVLTSLLKGTDPDLVAGIPFILAMFPISILMTSVMIAVEFKFGSQKSRLVLFVVYGLIFAVFTGITKVPAFASIAASFISFIKKTPPLMIGIITTVIFLAIEAGLYQFAVMTMTDREF